jgi:hypothetical protein
MSARRDLFQHAGQSWKIPFFIRDNDNAVLPLPAGTVVQFRLADPLGDGITVTNSDAITLTDPMGGAGVVSITPAMQTTAGLTARKDYRYELKIQTPDISSVQAQGKFTVLPSLFATA